MHDCLSTIKICTLLVNIGRVMQPKKKKKNLGLEYSCKTDSTTLNFASIKRESSEKIQLFNDSLILFTSETNVSLKRV